MLFDHVNLFYMLSAQELLNYASTLINVTF